MASRLGAFAARRSEGGFRALVAVGAALVVLLIHRQVFEFIASRKQFAVPELKAAVAPSWADRQGVQVVRIEGGEASLFDPTLVERVGRAFESCAWIRKVDAVERVFPDQIRVRFEYRRAHVAVRRENGYVLVDPDGVRLPGVYVQPPTCDRAVHVAGVGSAPPEPGRVWEDAALRSAMAMADFIEATPLLKGLDLAEIDVANHGGREDVRRSEMDLVTRAGCVLAWGRTPATAKFGDPTEAEKLENLRGVLASYPALRGVRHAGLYFRGTSPLRISDPTVQRR